jgi:MFS family permease
VSLAEQHSGLTAAAPSARRRDWSGIGPNVVFLGLTSLFTDVSSEMVAAILPLYLVFHLGLTPFQFGVVDGLYQGATALVRLGGGLSADLWRRYKEVAAVGYGLSAACKAGLLAVGGAWLGIVALVLLDRLGKGIRTAPRDALISLSSAPTRLATAFGIHRALDTAGALLGPVLAFALLAAAPGAFDAVFVVSFCAALVGLGVLLLFVENAGARTAPASTRAWSFAWAAPALAAPGFLPLLLVGGLLGLTTISDAFLYLVLQRQLTFHVGLLPLLPVGTGVAYFLLAIPVGWLADRVGRRRIFLGGYGLLLVVYGVVSRPAAGLLELGVALALLGAYYAATDGVLMALGSVGLPAEVRATGLALLATAVGVARLLASLAFGAVWSWWSVETALTLFAAGLVAALVLAFLALRGSDRPTPESAHG